jgi:hypothetical protein
MPGEGRPPTVSNVSRSEGKAGGLRGEPLKAVGASRSVPSPVLDTEERRQRSMGRFGWPLRGPAPCAGLSSAPALRQAPSAATAEAVASHDAFAVAPARRTPSKAPHRPLRAAAYSHAGVRRRRCSASDLSSSAADSRICQTQRFPRPKRGITRIIRHPALPGIRFP